jgi:hypothetical protein
MIVNRMIRKRRMTVYRMIKQDDECKQEDDSKAYHTNKQDNILQAGM